MYVDLGESFPTHIFLQNLASIQPRTSLVKFARSSNAAAPRPNFIAQARCLGTADCHSLTFLNPYKAVFNMAECTVIKGPPGAFAGRGCSRPA